MLCQKCGKNQATTHIKTIRNGSLKEYMLCSDCAKQLGYDSLFSGFGFPGAIFGGLLGQSTFNKPIDEERCPECGKSFNEIAESGKVGCGKCYDVFYDRLIPTIRKIHGTGVHIGKNPGKSAIVLSNPEKHMAVTSVNPVEQKKILLKNAIDEQRFEDAAKLRDEIKEMEKDG